MASLHESQAFLDQFDKCLPLCEKGDAVTVINALHTLNTITHGSIAQARELDPAAGKDFVCSFLIELELALELYISPSRKLGTIDGGLPALYSFSEDDLTHLVEVPSPQTKFKVRKFLEALGVEPSADFESRGVASVVGDFLKYQVKPSLSSAVPAPPLFSKKPESRNISWADQCSSGSDSDNDSLPSLAEEASDTECLDAELPAEQKVETIEPEEEEEAVEEEEVDGEEEEAEEHVAIFLWASPSKPAHYEEEHCHSSCDDHARGSNNKKKMGKTDPFFKTRMCKNWEQTGACPFGERCNFAHGHDELRGADTTLMLIASGGASKATARRKEEEESTSAEGNRRRNDGTNYKTKMCKNVEVTGTCKFGDRCVFAHSQEELRRSARR